MKLYRRFLEEGLSSSFDPTKKARFGFILGDEAFFEKIKADYLTGLTSPEIPQLRQARKSFSIEGIQARIAALGGPDTLKSKLLIYALKTYTPLTLKEIQERMKLSSHHMVYKSITRLKEASQKDRGLQKIIERLDREMSIV